MINRLPIINKVQISEDLSNIRNGARILNGYYQHFYLAMLYREKLYDAILLNYNHPLESHQHCKSGVIHVRRGDYFSRENISRYGVCDADYFQRGISFLRDSHGVKYFKIVSDDPDWCSKNIKGVDEYSGSKDELSDFIEISRYKYKIISNSSFSAWAAYFGPDNGVVVAPKFWESGLASLSHTIVNKDWILV